MFSHKPFQNIHKIHNGKISTNIFDFHIYSQNLYIIYIWHPTVFMNPSSWAMVSVACNLSWPSGKLSLVSFCRRSTAFFTYLWGSSRAALDKKFIFILIKRWIIQNYLNSSVDILPPSHFLFAPCSRGMWSSKYAAAAKIINLMELGSIMERTSMCSLQRSSFLLSWPSSMSWMR